MKTELAGGYIDTQLKDAVMHIEFFHPSSNSLPGAILQALAHAIQDAGNNTAVKVIVLKSGGSSAFCAGASFTELAAIQNETEGLNFFSGFAQVINAMRLCPKFIIGRIQGKCVGGGVGLAASVDYAIAQAGSDIKLSELAIGIGPFVVGPAIERKMGVSAFAQLAIDATNWRSAEWAKNMGLFAELHSSPDQLDASIAKLSNTLANSNPEAMAILKANTWANTEHWTALLAERAATSGRLILSAFSTNAIQQFKDKIAAKKASNTP